MVNSHDGHPIATSARSTGSVYSLLAHVAASGMQGEFHFENRIFEGARASNCRLGLPQGAWIGIWSLTWMVVCDWHGQTDDEAFDRKAVEVYLSNGSNDGGCATNSSDGLFLFCFRVPSTSYHTKTFCAVRQRRPRPD